MIAEAMAGNAEGALDYYLRINPSAREEISEIHRCEPYVYAQMIAGKDAPTHGEAKNSWLSGTAAWNFVAISQWILGIRPEHDGLRIDPCVPADWGDSRSRACSAAPRTRSPCASGRGLPVRVSHLIVDGKTISGNLVPLPAGRPEGDRGRGLRRVSHDGGRDRCQRLRLLR
jgi:cellobiose phosphorylase